MSNYESNEANMESIFLAGELAPAGLYQRIGTSHTVRLIHQDYLPATFDGRVACYARVQSLWSEIEDLNLQELAEQLPVAA